MTANIGSRITCNPMALCDNLVVLCAAYCRVVVRRFNRWRPLARDYSHTCNGDADTTPEVLIGGCKLGATTIIVQIRM
jgi:hypothetical protein